ncbi:hypothetical protein JTE90_014523, partial [Oedothorax gibbosus]
MLYKSVLNLKRGLKGYSDPRLSGDPETPVPAQALLPKMLGQRGFPWRVRREKK